MIKKDYSVAKRQEKQVDSSNQYFATASNVNIGSYYALLSQIPICHTCESNINSTTSSAYTIDIATTQNLISLNSITLHRFYCLCTHTKKDLHQVLITFSTILNNCIGARMKKSNCFVRKDNV